MDYDDARTVFQHHLSVITSECERCVKGMRERGAPELDIFATLQSFSNQRDEVVRQIAEAERQEMLDELEELKRRMR